MAGPAEQALRNAVETGRHGRIDGTKLQWEDGAVLLQTIATQLDNCRSALVGSDFSGQTAQKAIAALAASEKSMNDKSQEMTMGAGALANAAAALRKAEQDLAALQAVPAQPQKRHVDDPTSEAAVNAEKDFQRDTDAYNAALAARESQARAALVELEGKQRDSADTMMKIHGESDPWEQPVGGGGGGGGGSTPRPADQRSYNPVPDGGRHHADFVGTVIDDGGRGDDHDGRDDDTGTTTTTPTTTTTTTTTPTTTTVTHPPTETGTVVGTPQGPGLPTATPTGGTAGGGTLGAGTLGGAPSGGSVGSVAGGVAAGAGIGVAGLGGLIGGASGVGGTLPVSATGGAAGQGRAIGAGGARGGSGVLGRGSAVPVSAGAAGGARGGAAPAGGRTGGASRAGRSGAAGGRGGAAAGAGGRGTAAAGGAGASGRGRKGRERERGTSQDFFDDGSDWLDDEGVGPDVLR